jgi:hypothetical protein
MKVTKRPSTATHKRRQVGQVMTEYVLITVLICLGLFLPLGQHPSVAEQLGRAVANFFRGFSYIVSIS